MTEERPNILILDAATGEVIHRPLTDEEWEQHKINAQAIQAAGLDRHWIGDMKE